MKSFIKKLNAYVFREFQPHLYEVYMMYCCYSVLFAMNRTKGEKMLITSSRGISTKEKKTRPVKNSCTRIVICVLCHFTYKYYAQDRMGRIA